MSLRDWIQGNTSANPASPRRPVVFYVFRDTADEHAFVAGRLTRPRRLPSVQLGEEVFNQRRDLLQPLMDFVSQHGRLPVDMELDITLQIKEVFGSIARAFSLIRRVTGPNPWETVRRERRDDLLVYLALASFGKRAKFGQLPDPLRHDVSAFFGTYKAACTEADRLLYSAGDQGAIDRACARAPVGKILPGALYVHHTALPRLAPLLRVYEGCGRQLAGSIEGLTLIKLGRRQHKVSYLVYPEFDRVGHPALAEAFMSDLSRLNLHHRDYRRASSPPILHRKDLMVSGDHPGHRRFARLTAREEALGLLNTGRPIGTRDEWHAVLRERGVSIRGHQVALNSR